MRFLKKHILSGNPLVAIVVSLLMIVVMILFATFFQPRLAQSIDTKVDTKALSQKELFALRRKGTYQEINPGLMPGNPLYLFDSIGEFIKTNFFLRDEQKKVIQALLITQEKTSEIQKISSHTPDIKKAIRQQSRYILIIKKGLAKLEEQNDPNLFHVATKTAESINRQLYILHTIQNNINDKILSALLFQSITQLEDGAKAANTIFEHRLEQEDAMFRVRHESF